MSAPTLNNQSTVRGRDCYVFGLSAIAASNGSVSETQTSFLGSFKSIEFALKREYAEVTGANDLSKSRRVIRWDFSPITVSGYNRSGVSDATTVFNTGAHVQLQFTELNSSASWLVNAAVMEVHTKVNETVNEYTLTLEAEGIPQFAPDGSTYANINLE